MIVDSSALIAVLRNEVEREQFIEIMVDQPCRMSAATWMEAAMVADGSSDPRAGARLDALIETFEIELVAFTPDHARSARHAFRRYGRGSGSPARLNFGDCISYATSAISGEPLLFKGDDFIHTDVLKVPRH